MEAIKTRSHIGADGILKLEMPVGVANRDVEILIVVQPLETEELDAMGYPIGYFDETYGSFADDPLERGEQPPMDIRDELE